MRAHIQVHTWAALLLQTSLLQQNALLQTSTGGGKCQKMLLVHFLFCLWVQSVILKQRGDIWKPLLLHHELKHKEGFINDPESPAMLFALVNCTIVCSGAFAARVGLFIMCLAHVSRVYYRFIMFLCLCASQFRTGFDLKDWKVQTFLVELHHKCYP